MISPLFTTIVLGAVFIWIYMRITTKKNDSQIKELLEKERRANFTRKQSLDGLQYIVINPADFPVEEPYDNELISELMKRINILSTQKIVNFTGVTNTDLKLTYGVANLPTLTEYDQNYTLLCRTIYDLGRELDALDKKDAAISVLEQGIKCGTDISANYLLLADLYLATGKRSNIAKLISSAENINSMTKEATISKLKDKMYNNTQSGVILSDNDGIVSAISSSSNIDSGLPEDILDILETEPYKSDDQKQ